MAVLIASSAVIGGVLEGAPAASAATPYPVDVELGNTHACARLSDASIRCWGSNIYGQLGDGTTTKRTGVVNPGLSSVVALAVAADSTCALTGAGLVKCWGFNWAGQVGDGTGMTRTAPVPLWFGGRAVRAIATGPDSAHVCAVTTDDQLYCWGSNSSGQLGVGDNENRWVPTRVATPTLKILGLAVGASMTCVQFDGPSGTKDFRCSGSNHWGQFGDGTKTGSTMLKPVADLGSEHRVIAASTRLCRLIPGSSIRCAGEGYLGNGTTEPSPVMVDVPGRYSTVSTAHHSCAYESYVGEYRCWGKGWLGELGLGTRPDAAALRPQPVYGVRAPSTDAADIDTGGGEYYAFTCAIGVDSQGARRVYCWGDNAFRQLGYDSSDSRGLPFGVRHSVSWTPARVIGI